jgi:hypothetical protein
MRSSVLLTSGSPLRDGRRSGRLRVVAAALTVTGLLALAAGSPTSAHAAFTLSACEGGPVQGEGSSLQKGAQEKFWDTGEVFKSPVFGCGAGAPLITYKSASSGCGLDSMGAGDEASGCTFSSKEPNPPAGYRDEVDRFGASDFAPNPEEETNINNGPNGAGNPGSGKIHVIPVAGAAITVVVHFPDGCELTNPGTGTAASGVGTLNEDTTTGGVNDPTGAATNDASANETLRVHIPAEALEEIWVHKITEWGEIPTPVGGKKLKEFLKGTPTGPQAGSFTCADFPIYRIVREDTSGTSYNFKAYLGILPFKSDEGGELWTASTSEVGHKNTAWPLGSASSTGVPSDVNTTTSPNVCESPTHICHAAAGKGSSLAAAVRETDGSIGYLDLATAREEHFDLEENKKDHDYWLPLEPVSAPATPGTPGVVKDGVFVEPTAKPTAHFNGTLASEKGANCSGAAYRGIPTAPASDPTLGDWSKAIATGGTTYPVCALTYDLAFDDDATVYGNTPLEEARARTVKDYLTSVTSSGGQTGLKEFDYSVLPQSPSLPLVTDAQTGVAAIGWNKSAGAGGTKEEPVTPPSGGGGGGGGGSTTPAATVVTPPSNAFSIASAKVKGKDIVLSLVLPGAGKVQIKATGAGVTVSSVSASVGGGQGTVTLPISGAALKKLAKAKSKKISVKITVTFTPTGGTAASQTKTITITQAAVATKKKKTTKKKKG